MKLSTGQEAQRQIKQLTQSITMDKEITAKNLRETFIKLNAGGTARQQARLLILDEFNDRNSNVVAKTWDAICSYVHGKHVQASHISDIPKAFFDLSQWHFTEKKDFQPGKGLDEIIGTVETTLAGDYLMSFKHFSTRIFAPSFNK